MLDDKKKTVFRKIIAFCVICVLVNLTAVEAAVPRKHIKEGNRLYREGDYVGAGVKFLAALKQAPESDIVHFNLGTALYKDELYEEAVEHFQKALLSDDDELKEKAYYNTGNALYRYGLDRENIDPEDAISSLEDSLGQYERALNIDKEDEDTKHNYAFVKKELKRIMEQQQQQPQQSQQEKSQEKKDQEQQQQQDQQSQEEQKQQQQSQQQEQEGQQDQQKRHGESQDQEEKSDQQHGQSGQEDYNEQQGNDAQPQNAEELTRKEAQMLLKSYQQTEEPQGQLNIHPKKRDTRPVLKDW